MQCNILFISMFSAEKGVPNFWLTAMKTNDILAEEVGSCGGLVVFIFSAFNYESNWKYDLLFDLRLLSVMKGLSNILRISSGLGLKNQKASSLSFSLIQIHTSKIVSLLRLTI